MGYSVGVYRIFSSLFKPRTEVSRSTGMHKHCNRALRRQGYVCSHYIEQIRVDWCTCFHRLQNKLLISSAALAFITCSTFKSKSHPFQREKEGSGHTETIEITTAEVQKWAQKHLILKVFWGRHVPRPPSCCVVVVMCPSNLLLPASTTVVL